MYNKTQLNSIKIYSVTNYISGGLSEIYSVANYIPGGLSEIYIVANYIPGGLKQITNLFAKTNLRDAGTLLSKCFIEY